MGKIKLSNLVYLLNRSASNDDGHDHEGLISEVLDTLIRLELIDRNRVEFDVEDVWVAFLHKQMANLRTVDSLSAV